MIINNLFVVISFIYVAIPFPQCVLCVCIVTILLVVVFINCSTLQQTKASWLKATVFI